MKIRLNDLGAMLSGDQDLPPCWWLSGDEPLQMLEAADQIRRHYRSVGFSEREVFDIDRGFNWQTFSESSRSLSLFASRRIFELRLSTPKLDEAGRKSLQACLDDPDPDLVLLISSPRLERATLETKWFKAIESRSALLSIWPVDRDHLEEWLRQRLRREGIEADPEALQILSDKVEGNLPAAAQEIEKLKLLMGEGSDGVRMGVDTVTQVVADSSRHTVFQLVDSALLGNAARALKILDGLRAEGTFPLPVLSVIARELRSLLPMVEKRDQGQGINSVMEAHRIWRSRRRTVGAALQRLQREQIWQLLEQARLTDQAIKGMVRANPWDELSLMLLSLSGCRTATMKQRVPERRGAGLSTTPNLPAANRD